MKRLLILICVLALLTTGCSYWTVKARTIEYPDSGPPRVCVTTNEAMLRNSCSDEHGEPLTLRCYEDAKIGARWPETCADSRVTDLTLALRQVWWWVFWISILGSPIVGFICSVYQGLRLSASGWQPLPAAAVGMVSGFGAWLGTTIISLLLCYAAFLILWS